MSAPRIVLTGTRAAGGLPFAMSAITALPWATAPGVVLPADGPTDAQQLLAQWPDARAVVIAEHPATGLALALQAGVADDPVGWLDEWQSSGADLLRLVQRLRHRSFVVGAAEQAVHPEAMLARVSELVAAPLARSTRPPAASTPVDPLCGAAAIALVDAHPPVLRTWKELEACCDWLLTPGEGFNALSPTPDGPGIVARLAAHHQLALDLQSAGEQRSELAVLRQRVAQAEASLERSTADDAQIRELQSQIEQLQTHHRSEQQADREYALLLSHLFETQEALERAERALRAAPAEPPTVTGHQPAAPDAHVQIDEAVLGQARDERPYRELSFTLRGVRIGARHVGQAPVRIVEHHGHPGLVLLSGKGTGASLLLDRWTEDGTEGDRRFMLLVPADERCRATIAAMGASDWLVLLAVVASAQACVAAGTPARRTTWLPLATRLHDQLLTLPPRLRHDGLVPDATTGDDADARGLVLRNVSWASRRLPELRLRWRTGGNRPGFGIARGADGSEPLISWPDGEDGEAPDVIWIPPVDRGTDAGRSPWLALGDPDRAFVRAVLSELPDALSAASASWTGAPANAIAAVRRDCEAALRATGRLQTGNPQTRLLRRLFRRVVGTRNAAP